MEKEIFIQPSNFKKPDYERFVIVADIGGTNTYVAIMAVRDSKHFELVFKHSHVTKELCHIYDALNLALKEAKEMYDIETGIACIGAAGPTSRHRGYIKLTNVDLEINVHDILAHTLLGKVILVNDFEAIGYGIDLLDMKKDVIKIPHVGEDMTGGWTVMNSIAVIGAGTGLGMSIAPYDAKKHFHAPMPSEGGHSDLIAYDKDEWELVDYLKKKVLIKKDVHPEMERVLCASGMENIFDFLAGKTLAKNPLLKRISKLSGVEKLKEIEANYEHDAVCKRTVDLFLGFYARAAKSLALMSQCYAGLFITGRIALKHKDKFMHQSFMRIFEAHDKRSDVLRKVPVYLVTNRDVGLYGCCNVAVNFFNI